jgi:hypothetical protein
MALHYLAEPLEQYVGKWFRRKFSEYLYLYEINRNDKQYPIRMIQLSAEYVGWEEFPVETTEFDEVRPRDIEMQTVIKIFFEREIPK